MSAFFAKTHAAQAKIVAASSHTTFAFSESAAQEPAPSRFELMQEKCELGILRSTPRYVRPQSEFNRVLRSQQ